MSNTDEKVTAVRGTDNLADIGAHQAGHGSSGR
jgi:hypothetical protein